MREGSEMRVAQHKINSLRLKSWLPEHAHGGKPVVLAGQELPSQVGGILHGPMRVLCLGPGDWLVMSHEHMGSSMRAHFARDLSEQGLALVELTDGLAALEVSGSAAREVLSKGCGLDFHPRSFPQGRCARTRFAQIPVVIECLDETPRFELYFPRSYCYYLHSWLTDAATEFASA